MINRFLKTEDIKAYFLSDYNNNGKKYDFTKIMYQWIEDGDWTIIIKNSKASFVGIETRQKSLFKRFYQLLTSYFDPRNTQSLWDSYTKIQNINTQHIEPKYKNILRKFFQSYYLYVINNFNDYEDEEHLKSILLNSEATSLISEKVPYRILRTNFPEGSKYFQVFCTESRAIKGHELYHYFSNVYVKADNLFIIDLIRSYIKKISENIKYTTHSMSIYKAIFYYFDLSLSKKVEKLSDFDKHTFIEQKRYFSKLEDEGKMPRSKNISYFSVLVSIYKYIDDEYRNRYGKPLFDDIEFNSRLLSSNVFKESMFDVFKVVFPSPFDSVEISDKWIVTPRLDNRSKNLNIYRALDFSEVNCKVLREDLKSHIWNYNTRDPIDRFSHLVEFLNVMERQVSQQLNKTDSPYYSVDFITYYYMALTERNDIGEHMKNSIIYSIRTLLRHIQGKYNIPEFILAMFKELPLGDYQKGNPINTRDLKIINQEFYKSTRKHRESLYIIFKLSLITKLRPSEILGLERDCIVSKNDNFGIIEYFSKIDKLKKVQGTFTMDVIRDIEKAIDLTNEAFETARPEERKYIFIDKEHAKSSGSSSENIIRLTTPYRKLFHKIIKNLFEEKKISQWYTTYSCRDTHINNAFELLEDDKINSHELTTITGNSAKIARKHYLSRSRRTKRYLESMYKVVLLDENLHGTIDHDENKQDINYPVHDDLGSCKSETCVKLNTPEDSLYKCLTCKYFVTTLDKIPIFESRVEKLKYNIENSQNPTERDFYKHLLELNLRYLREMYSLKGV